MDSHKKLRKHKKDKKKKKRRHRSSSSSDSSSGDEWVEAPSVSQSSTSTGSKAQDTKSAPKKEDDDQWTSISDLFRTRQEIQEKRKPKADERVNILDKPGQSARELNPYWKDGGSGLPEEERGGGRVTNCTVGDFGLDWMRRAMRRAKEQAQEEKRPLEEVVAERWGSLAKLESMIKEAEMKSAKSKYNHGDDGSRYRRQRTNYEKCHRDDTSRQRFMKPKNESSGEESDGCQRRKTDRFGERKEENDDDWRKNEKKKKAFTRPREKEEEEEEEREKTGYHRRKADKEDDDWRRKKKQTFARPRDDEEEEEREKERRKGRENESEWRRNKSSSSSGGSWRKKSSDPVVADKKNNDDNFARNASRSSNNDDDDDDVIKQDGGETMTPQPPPAPALTADERNELAAKLVKAEIMGNTELAAELKARLEQAREAAVAPERVVLTTTDVRGFTQPLAAPAAAACSAGKRGGQKKAKTHDETGKRVRYFADDDRFTLQEMFEREKRSTAEDQNEMFARLAGKKIGDLDSARDMDDVFEETAAVGGEAARGREEARARAKAIGQHQRSTRAIDACHWCLDSAHLLKHLVVAIGTKVYLCLPPYESLTEGHCLIVTSQHVTCCVQADEEVWEEIQTFRKALVALFLSEDMDCVFFEHAAGFSRFPHLVLHCVPLPKEQGDLAPIFFKKAILECETEWSTNKKLIDLAGRSVRRCVPRGLPYFFVDFGLQAGYAHVIEDEQLFPRNFAQEIIGGILDVDHSKWRKPRREKFDDQRKKVVQFTKLWKPFDFTKNSS